MPVANLEKLQEALASWSTPRQMSDQRFDQTHEHFERSSSQQLQILDWLRNFVSSHAGSSAGCGPDSLRILSVGCGSGILDNPLIESVAAEFERVEYTGVDPNEVACRRFKNGFASLGLTNVRLDLRNHPIEALNCGDRFDIVHAVHSLYYFDDPAATVDRLVNLLAPEGMLVVIQAPREELNQLANCFWSHHVEGSVWYSDCLSRHLSERGIRFTKHRIQGWVNVSRCFETGCPQGAMMLDFITQSDCRHIDREISDLCLNYLRTVGRQEDDRWLVAHPADAFVIHPTVRLDATQTFPEVERTGGPARPAAGLTGTFRAPVAR